MILKVENLLGGAVISIHYSEAPEKTQGICVLDVNEVKDLCMAIEGYRNWSKGDEMSLVWSRGGIATFVIGTSTEAISAMLTGSMRNYMMSRDESKIWKLGEAMT